jgi:mono/diheme cytochrome c family protein
MCSIATDLRRLEPRSFFAAALPRRFAAVGREWRFVRLLVMLVGITPGVALADTANLPEVDLQFYQSQVAPLLDVHCNKCHGAESKFRGGLDLSSRQGLLAGGDSGPAIDMDAPESSLLLDAINYRGLEMPPAGKLPAAEIAVLTEWVRRGAPLPVEATSRTKHEEGPPKAADHREHWAFKPVVNGPVPEGSPADWGNSPIDAFVLQRLTAAGLEPTKEADRRALIRRAYFDLTGLPPTIQQVEAFVQSPDPNAFEHVLDELLASPQYGEKWGRFWLDLVRYAETNSFERDGAKPEAWKYRDYVIASFNSDKRYDRFVMEQLAGDELPDASKETRIATGYYRLGTWDDEPSDRTQALYDELDEIVATTSQVLLGLTVNCARCHDHKIDPISQRDYYQTLAMFQDVALDGHRTSPYELVDLSDSPVVAAYRERDAELGRIRHRLHELEQAAIARMPGVDQRRTETDQRQQVLNEKLAEFQSAEEGAEYRRLREELVAWEQKQLPARELAMGVATAATNPRPTHLLIRGNPHAPGAEVEPGFLEVLSGVPSVGSISPAATSLGRRLHLARWVTQPDHPLTYRVYVNRIWQQHFGRGLIRSASNFGLKGDQPTHPELLDWLTTQFIRGGFHTKPLHKLIMLSKTYQLSSEPTEDQLRIDPANDLLGRFDLRRLSAEELRDTMLLVSGQLNLKLGGPSVYPAMPAEVLAGQSQPGKGWETTPEAANSANRRSVYVHVKRSLLLPLLSSFDFPDPDGSCAVRFATTQPTQALSMLNGQFANEAAQEFAKFAAREAGHDQPSVVRKALETALARPASQAEVIRGLKLVNELVTDEGLPVEVALSRFCLMVLNLNEFVFVD